MYLILALLPFLFLCNDDDYWCTKEVRHVKGKQTDKLVCHDEITQYVRVTLENCYRGEVRVRTFEKQECVKSNKVEDLLVYSTTIHPKALK